MHKIIANTAITKRLIIVFLTISLSACSTNSSGDYPEHDSSLSTGQKALIYGTIGVAAIAAVLGSKNNRRTDKQKAVKADVVSTIQNDQITLSACKNHAGAICSLKWHGKEFIDDYDHGRLLQSASSFNNLGEGFNPTEGGGGSEDRYSALIGIRKSPDNLSLSTSTQMAYWNPVDNSKLSNHVLHKRVTLGYKGMPNVIQYSVQYDIPSDRTYKYGVFEALTGYMPKDFNHFWTYQSGTVKPYHVTPNTFTEQDKPIIASTADGQYAMGVWSPDLPQRGIGYGAFLLNFDVPKWNAVFREGNPRGSKHYRMFVFVGSLEMVRQAMQQLRV